MSNACSKPPSNSASHPACLDINTPVQIESHSAIHVLYNHHLHEIQFETISEIRAIIAKIGDVLTQSGLRFSNTSDVIEVHARLTFFMPSTSRECANSDWYDTTDDELIDHPRRFGFL
jgi:hypothetical protein